MTPPSVKELSDVQSPPPSVVPLQKAEPAHAQTQQSDELDWGEGNPEEQSSKTITNSEDDAADSSEVDVEVQKANEERTQYVDRMTQKFGAQLNSEIKRREANDLQRRDVKNPQNVDKFHDLQKLKEFKEN